MRQISLSHVIIVLCKYVQRKQEFEYMFYESSDNNEAFITGFGQFISEGIVFSKHSLFQMLLWLSSLDFISKNMSNLTEPCFISLSAIFLQMNLIN